jgi:hypothetical protein
LRVANVARWAIAMPAINLYFDIIDIVFSSPEQRPSAEA